MPIVREEWLAMTKEESIDPDLPICDAHHHLWDFPDYRYQKWARPTDCYMIEDFLRDVKGHNVVSTVFVECGSNYRADGLPATQPVGETEFVVESVKKLERRAPDIAAGIIGYADLGLGAAVAPVLEAHIAAGKDRFRGIRYACTWHTSSAFKSRATSPYPFSETKFMEGYAFLEKYHLSFDAWLYHTQLKELAHLASTFPGITIILNHIGGLLGSGPYAGRREAAFQEWQQGITVLAANPNVVIKLGGLGMPICGFGCYERPVPPGSAELAETMAPYFLWCIKQFGVHRCMFESNFPADKISYSYTVLWNAFKRITDKFSYKDRSALFHDTAARVYGLKKHQVTK